MSWMSSMVLLCDMCALSSGFVSWLGVPSRVDVLVALCGSWYGWLLV